MGYAGPTKITFAEIRDMGVRRLLIYCSDFQSRPSIVALTIAGAMKAIDSVMLIWRTLQFCR
jgi:hypothetical protein